MKKTLIITMLAACAIACRAQPTGNCSSAPSQQTTRSCADSQKISASGSTITVQNNGGLVPSFEELITGAPATVSVVIKGCGPSATCDTLDTYTTVANAVRAPTVAKFYNYYTVTATWTGGTNAAVQVNTAITSARLGNGNGTTVTSIIPGTNLTCSPNSPNCTGDVTLNATGGGGAASALPAWLTKLQAVKKGTENARILWPGDSTYFSYNSSATATQYVANSVGVKYCADLNQFYGIKCQWNTWFGGGVGLASFGTDDSRTTQGSSWTLDCTVKIIGGCALQATTSTNAYAFRPAQWSGQVGALGSTLVDANIDTCEVYYVQQPGGGVLAVNFDGGTATTFNTSGTASIVKAVVAAGSLAAHTFNHLWSSGSKVDIAGDVCYDSTTSSVITMLAGAGGITSAQMTDQTQPYGPGFSAPYAVLAPDLAIVEAGLINDWNTASGINTTASKANVTTLTNALIAAGTNVALYSPNPQNPAVAQAATTAVQATYVEGMRRVAAATSNTGSTATLPFIDNFNSWQSYAISSPLGWYGDTGTHPSGVGYQETATAAETATVATILPANSFGANLTPWYNLVPAQYLAWNTGSISANYTLLSTDSYKYANCSGCTVTLPATPLSSGFQEGKEITIKNIGAASVVISSPNTFNTPTGVDPGGTATFVIINGSWSGKQKWSPVAQANYMVFSYTSPGGNYTAVGTEGVIKVPSGFTISMPFPTGAMNGFGTLIYNTSPTATETINGTGGASYSGPAALGGGCTTMVANFNTATWVPLLSSCPLHSGKVTLVAGTTSTPVSSTYACTPGAGCNYSVSNCGPAGTAIGTPAVIASSIVVGTSFVISSMSPTNTVLIGDTSDICWRIN